MSYKFNTTKRFEKDVAKLTRDAQMQIADCMKKIEQLENPRTVGKPLQGNRKGQWRYRAGDFRIICDIKDEEFIILALEAGNRKSIYCG